jgi:hypothetical protein
MSGLNYIGPSPSAADDVMTQRAVTELLDTGTTRGYALDRITALSAPYATLDYVNLADNNYVTPSAVDSGDALNVPLTAKGVPNGVGTLDGAGLVPLTQSPNLGVGFAKGPYGIASQITTDTTTASVVQIAQIDVGVAAITFKTWAFATAYVQQQDKAARASLELRIGDTTQTSYAAQTLIATGSGRSGFTDFQSVTAQVAGSAPGLSATAGRSPSTHWLITLWLVSAGGATLIKANNILTCSAYLIRTAL